MSSIMSLCHKLQTVYICIHTNFVFLFLNRSKFKDIQTTQLQKLFEQFILKNPSREYNVRYWNFDTNDLFRSLNTFEDRVNCIKVCDKSS